MKDITLYTAKPLDVDVYRPLLVKSLKNCRENGANGIEITAPSTLFLEFYNEKLSEYPDDIYTKEEKETYYAFLGSEEAYMNDIEFHRAIDVKRVLEVLMSQGEKIFVEVDVINEWKGSAEDFLRDYRET